MSLIQALEQLQAENGWLSKDALRELSAEIQTPLYRLQEIVSFYPHFLTTPPARLTVAVCRDMSCHLHGCEGLAERIREAAGDLPAEIIETSCVGACEMAPAARVNGTPVEVADVRALAAALRTGSLPVPDRATRDWRCDPYGPAGEGAAGPDGAQYDAFRQLLSQDDPAAVDALISTLKDSRLRGMGGAGFPTGLKWDLVKKEQAFPKYVVCNADESEPGTFKDRVVMEDLPHLVIEGMMLAGYSVGAEKGILYIRHEYGRARQALQAALDEARDAGWLGDDILGSGFSFDIEIFVSPGGYILGEETALLEALEDRRGEPRNKPPFPGQKGFGGQPTLMNNVETFAHIPSIVLRGVDWWHAQGAGDFSGLKFISVSGHVSNPGVYEIPMGTTIRELIDLCGGMLDGRPLKAFAPGGASSNFLPPDRVDTPIDFDALAEAGSMMGSGALVVVAEGTPLLPLAANVVRFFRNESCGKCVPCRDGTEKATVMLEDAARTGGPIDMDVIAKLNLLLTETSICGLGYVALNPLISVAEHWPDEVPGAMNGETS